MVWNERETHNPSCLPHIRLDRRVCPVCGSLGNPELPPPPDDPPDGSLTLSMANPAAIYCEELGYTYTTFSAPAGDYSVCRLPDGSQCDAWDFLEGQCGTNFSLCTRLGYTVDSGAMVTMNSHPNTQYALTRAAR